MKGSGSDADLRPVHFHLHPQHKFRVFRSLFTERAARPGIQPGGADLMKNLARRIIRGSLSQESTASGREESRVIQTCKYEDKGKTFIKLRSEVWRTHGPNRRMDGQEFRPLHQYQAIPPPSPFFTPCPSSIRRPFSPRPLRFWPPVHRSRRAWADNRRHPAWLPPWPSRWTRARSG